jgi:glycosyltransferase involved in cell wall biosynthesis
MESVGAMRGTARLQRCATDQAHASGETRARVTARVLHVFSGDLWAGAEVMVANLLEQLSLDPTLEVIAVGLNEGTLTRRLAAQGIETHVVTEGVRSFVGLALELASRLRGRRVDIVHAHRYKENLLATVVAPMLGARRKVTTVHGVAEKAGRGSLRGGVAAAMDRLAIRRSFDAVVAVSAEMRTILLGRYGVRPERIRLIYNGVDLPLEWDAGERSEPREVHIGTVGRLVPVKGYRLFLEFAAQLRRRHPGVRFSILGDGPMMAELSSEAARLGIRESVTFLPPRADPHAYYRDVDIYVNTSLHEGLPLSVLEAMACGRPVVAPRVGGIPEVVVDGQHGFLVDRRDPAAFAERCERLMEDRGLRRALGQNGRARVAEAFSRRRMAEGYRAVYEELCGER